MATYDPHANFSYATVTVAPSPATSGTTLSVSNTLAANFPDPATAGAYNVGVWPANQMPLSSNTELVRITAKGAADSGGTGNTQLTIIRTQESTSARSIQVGDQIANNITKKWFTDIETNKVDGPASATDNALVRYDLTTGKLVQNSNAILDDTGSLSLAVALPVSSGGTGTTTALTAGSVVFAGTSGVYNQDATNLVWDNTNKILTIRDMTFGNTGSTLERGIRSDGSGNLLVRATLTNPGSIYYDTRGTGAHIWENRNAGDTAWTEIMRLTNAGVLTLATDLAITEGGTGASTVAGARTNLGITLTIATSQSGLQADYICSSNTNDQSTTTQTTINSAFTALAAAGGGTIKLRAGTFYVKTPGISIPSNCTLEGEGFATIIYRADGSAFAGTIHNENASSGQDSNIIIRNLMVNGNSAGAGGNDPRDDIVLTGAYNITTRSWL